MFKIFIQSLFAFVATFGFGIIFNIKGKNLIFASFAGGLSWFVYELALKYTGSTGLSMFLSAVSFSAYCEILARKLKTPVTTLVICALIPLVPGSGMYYTMHAAITGDAMKAIDLGIDTLSNAGALAVGILFVSTITRHYFLAKAKKEALILKAKQKFIHKKRDF